jgi:carbonic anhydrase
MNVRTFASTHAFAGVALCGVALSAAVTTRAADSAPAHWSYDGQTGPKHWGAEDPAFALCSGGKHQSPIDIDKAVVRNLPELEFDYKNTALNVTDTGHSFQVNAANGGGGFTVAGERYDFLQVHFHESSEERLHGKPYSMEAHLVHKNAKGELAVVAVLIRKGKTNEFLKPIFDNFPTKGAIETDVAGETINMMNFLPAHHGYFTFEGSLTTPPCSEHVRWFVLKTPVEASEAQVMQFGVRYPHNSRPTQPLNGRVIVESTAD